MVPRRAAFFDLDRTLVRKNTAQLFTQYRRDLGELSLGHRGRVTYWLFLYALGVVDAPRVARLALAEFAGTTESAMRQRCADWFPRYVSPHLSPAGRDAVAAHLAQGDLVAIASAATEFIVELVAAELGIRHWICTELVVDEAGCFTGQVVEPLCYGEGKVTAARRFAEAQGLALENCTFYSDSVTDLPLLEAVGRPVAINPDLRLRRIARARGWPVLSW